MKEHSDLESINLINKNLGNINKSIDTTFFMDRLLLGIGLRYGLLFTVFGIFIIFLVLNGTDNDLFFNLILTLILLALIPVGFYILWKKKFKR